MNCCRYGFAGLLSLVVASTVPTWPAVPSVLAESFVHRQVVVAAAVADELFVAVVVAAAVVSLVAVGEAALTADAAVPGPQNAVVGPAVDEHVRAPAVAAVAGSGWESSVQSSQVAVFAVAADGIAVAVAVVVVAAAAADRVDGVAAATAG